LQLSAVVDTSRRVAETSSRLDKIGLLAALLSRVPPAEIEIAAAYLCGTVPQPRLGVGWASLHGAMADTAAATPSVELAELNAVFDRIATISGKGSAGERQQILKELVARLTREEQGFLLGLVTGELRQGASEGVVIEAVARASELPAEQVRRAVMMSGSLPEVARAALTEGAEGLGRFSIELFRPVLPMLAGAAEDESEALAELGEAALEWKLDGARVQIHKSGDDVRIFSRNLNDVTAAVPELVQMARALPAAELILEGEVIALRPDGSPHPFQVTMTRFGRRLEVERMLESLPLTPVLFDLLYLDGSPLLDEPYRRRVDALGRSVGQSLVIPRLVTASVEQAAGFLASAIARGHEGIMAKALDAPYEAGRRGRRWLKVKPVRTLDLVVLAAEWGHGRRKGRLSNLHLGARDPVNGGFVMLGKTFKGMTDEMLAWQTAKLLELEAARDSYTVYVRPELVVEVAFNDVQESPQYPGGVALRFARIKRYRTDKTAAEADTIDAVRRIRLP
jgi:ATP-dependent DNA ligase I